MTQPTPPQTHSPPSSSPSSTTSTPKSKPSMSLDLSDLPPLLHPSPPSNTLLITNLNNPSTFHPVTLQKIRSLLSTPTPLNSFSPLRSFHRIIVSYPTTEAAIAMRIQLETTSLSLSGSSLSEENPQPAHEPPSDSDSDPEQSEPIKIYFGEHTPVTGVDDSNDQHLHPPSLGKLLFISPPPSPPMGWESREEDPPNRDVHAEDLQRALAGLNGHVSNEHEDGEAGDGSPDGMSDEEEESLRRFRNGGFGTNSNNNTNIHNSFSGRKRTATGSLMVYHPADHGGKEDLPKVMVEDTTADDDSNSELKLDAGKNGKIAMTHTARPPVELMEG